MINNGSSPQPISYNSPHGEGGILPVVGRTDSMLELLIDTSGNPESESGVHLQFAVDTARTETITAIRQVIVAHLKLVLTELLDNNKATLEQRLASRLDVGKTIANIIKAYDEDIANIVVGIIREGGGMGDYSIQAEIYAESILLPKIRKVLDLEDHEDVA